MKLSISSSSNSQFSSDKDLRHFEQLVIKNSPNIFQTSPEILGELSKLKCYN